MVSGAEALARATANDEDNAGAKANAGTKMVSGAENLKTYDRFFKVMRWSFEWPARGLWPDRDWAGRLFEPGEPGYSKRNTQLADGYNVRSVASGRRK